MYRKNMEVNLKTRGYKITGKENNEIHFEKPKGKKGKVVFLEKEKANVADLAEIFSEIVKDPIHIIIVYKQMTIPAIRSFRDDISNYFEDSEIIQQDTLLRNLMEHRLTPTSYRKLSKKEKKKITEYYKTPPEKFPLMLSTGKIATFFNFKEGDIIEIVSHYNFTTKKVDMEMPPQITYRYVCNEN
jgi:DNA-directed RNA polymerase subunit H (RpoH/RPB5)